MVCVTVPATSANLGVGFDCLGMALNLYARFSFTPSTALTIDGCEARFCNEDNLVWTSFCATLDALGHKTFPVHLTIDSDIPLSGGLGSSSACIVAGIVAAQLLSNHNYNQAFTLDMATKLEGHPDNVAPAIMGGLVSSFTAQVENNIKIEAQSSTPSTLNKAKGFKDRVFSTHFDVYSGLHFITVAPPYEVRTADARRVLPTTIPFEDAVWQMGRVVGVIDALTSGKMDVFAAANADRLHEPYRKALIADYKPLQKLALAYGADGFVISGSGSTMIAIAHQQKTAEALIDAIRSSYPDYWVRDLRADQMGVRFESVK
ncbi:homoserine kinase [Atopobium fossor]|uniref:homoserine kinase n=1 Tax=Atopobium fossor TaxID=39487 RepID=UPI00040A127E|nr:homoserine kinase [Atopobium fossor]